MHCTHRGWEKDNEYSFRSALVVGYGMKERGRKPSNERFKYATTLFWAVFSMN